MKAYVLCKYEGKCRFKHYKKHKADKKSGRLWYPMCAFEGTCNQKLTIYGNKLRSKASWLAEEGRPIIKTDGGEGKCVRESSRG